MWNQGTVNWPRALPCARYSQNPRYAALAPEPATDLPMLAALAMRCAGALARDLDVSMRLGAWARRRI